MPLESKVRVSGMFCVEGLLFLVILFVDAGVTGPDCTMAAAVESFER